MIATKDGDSLAIPQLHRNEERDGLDGVVASVDVVAHEQVVRIRRITADTKQLRQIMLRKEGRAHSMMLGPRGKRTGPRDASKRRTVGLFGESTYELTMYVATNGDRTSYGLHIGLLHQDFPRLEEGRPSEHIDVVIRMVGGRIDDQLGVARYQNRRYTKRNTPFRIAF